MQDKILTSCNQNISQILLEHSLLFNFFFVQIVSVTASPSSDHATILSTHSDKWIVSMSGQLCVTDNAVSQKQVTSYKYFCKFPWYRGRRDHMVVRFTTTYMQSVPITTNIVSVTPLRRGDLDSILCDKDCQWLEAGRGFSPGTPVFFTNKTGRHNITEILLKVVLNTINSHLPWYNFTHRNVCNPRHDECRGMGARSVLWVTDDAFHSVITVKPVLRGHLWYKDKVAL